jgi:hypothetical protein
VGTRTDAAVARVVAARAELDGEVDRLEAAGRSAVDVPAKIRRSPAKAAGIAGGVAFVALGGPKRLYRRAKRAVTGKEEELPSEMLPKEIEKTLNKLGDDGRKVRGTLEREFAKYLDERRKERQREGPVNALSALALALLRPISVRAGRNIVERALNPDAPSFEQQLERVRSRRKAAVSGDVAGAEVGGPRSEVGL